MQPTTFHVVRNYHCDIPTESMVAHARLRRRGQKRHAIESVKRHPPRPKSSRR